MRQNGTIKFFNQAKGYGFVSPEGGGKDVFVHVTAVQRSGIPELNEERRKELVKVAHKYAEAARVAVRHVRRDGLDTVKKLEKNHEISEDDQERLATDVQKATDGSISEIDQLLAAKEKEILTV